MSSSIVLSVIIPYYNANAWIERMLDSLLDQGLPEDEYEIIIVDDGSTQSVDSVLNYADTHDNIYYYRKENAGPSSARNKGIDIANGKWLYFCDSDDFVQPQAFSSVLKTIEDLDLDMLVCDWRVVQPDAIAISQEKPFHISDIQTGKDYLGLFTYNPMDIGFGAWRYFIKKEVIIKHGIRWENLVYIEDRIFQLDLLLVVERLAHANVVLYYYVQHQTSILHDKKKINYEKYATHIWHYIQRLSDAISDESLHLSSEATVVIDGWRDMAVFSLLINSFKYCPVSTTKHYLAILSNLEGTYPVKVIRKGLTRVARKCMGHKRLWITLCRLFHVLPLKTRLLF